MHIAPPPKSKARHRELAPSDDVHCKNACPAVGKKKLMRENPTLARSLEGCVWVAGMGFVMNEWAARDFRERRRAAFSFSPPAGYIRRKVNRIPYFERYCTVFSRSGTVTDTVHCCCCLCVAVTHLRRVRGVIRPTPGKDNALLPS